VAIGGVDADRAALARRHGAAGVAVVSAICGRPDVTAATRRIRAAWDRAGET
jgi:thiamine-phosphate pyrophosphorylase